MNTSKLITEMNDAAAKIGSKANREQAEQLIESGRVNAMDTINVEKAAPESDFDRIVRGSIECLMCDHNVNRHVTAFFAKFDIRA